ncbi:MAG: phosphatase PAP2 family protein [Bacteroidales bacterium]|nr:phosphatase PAP2 family protein [Bacteroidales bacterium]
MIDQLLEWDTQFLLFLNNFNHVFADPIMKELSGKWIWVPMYLGIAFLFWRRFGWKRALILIFAVGAAVALADSCSAKVIRPFFERMRPANIDNPISALVHIVENYRGGKYGFPSCHAANSFALAMSSALMLRVRWYSWFIFIWALFQCYTRVYLGVHYPGDLLVGACVGSFFGWLAWHCTRRFSNRYLSAVWKGLPVIFICLLTVLAVILTNTILLFFE